MFAGLAFELLFTRRTLYTFASVETTYGDRPFVIEIELVRFSKIAAPIQRFKRPTLVRTVTGSGHSSFSIYIYICTKRENFRDNLRSWPTDMNDSDYYVGETRQVPVGYPVSFVSSDKIRRISFLSRSYERRLTERFRFGGPNVFSRTYT